MNKRMDGKMNRERAGEGCQRAVAAPQDLGLGAQLRHAGLWKVVFQFFNHLSVAGLSGKSCAVKYT